MTPRDDSIENAVSPESFRLERNARGVLELRPTDARETGFGAIGVDFLKIVTHNVAGRSLRQPLARAVGLGGFAASSLRVMDATAGLGGDSWLLAALGCQVLSVERSAIVYQLVEDGLRRAEAFAPEIAARIDLREGDARDFLVGISEEELPDVIFLDPMFPPKRKAALERKEMRALRAVVGKDEDARELFALAITKVRRRVVVKRPLHAEPLVPDPVARHRGKSLRYDVYVPRP